MSGQSDFLCKTHPMLLWLRRGIIPAIGLGLGQNYAAYAALFFMNYAIMFREFKPNKFEFNACSMKVHFKVRLHKR